MKKEEPAPKRTGTATKRATKEGILMEKGPKATKGLGHLNRREMISDEYAEALRVASAEKGNMKIASVVKLLEAARRKGDFRASYALGTWYFHGEHFMVDKVKGFSLMLEAADNFVRDACYDVAVSYELGDGVKKNIRKAVTYYFRAMMLGESQSITEVGRLFYWGIGVSKNRAIAKELLNFQSREAGR